jgi:nucleotide-binding universal stress UspA family protein
MRVLIALDGSEFSQAALDSVTNRTWAGGSEFLLFTVAEPFLGDLGGMIPDDEKQCHMDLLDAQVKAVKLLMHPHKVTGEVGEGIACDEIVKTALQWHADFIVMGSRGRSGLDHFFLGSVAESVVNKSPCSVEVIKAPLRNAVLGNP